MKIVVSPAKALNENVISPVQTSTEPLFFKEAVEVNAVMQTKTKPEISKLMKISANLAELNYTRYHEFDDSNQTDRARQAVYLFDGDTYKGLDIHSLKADKVERLQNTLRILSGMYGLLKPLDRIQPYRLEMGTKLAVGEAKNLYAYWKPKISVALNEELEEDEILVNLASNEYFKSVDKKQLNSPVITPIFKDFKNGKLKVISFFAKRARGTMARYIIDNDINNLTGIHGFQGMDYTYSEAHTEKENEPVFIR